MNRLKSLGLLVMLALLIVVPAAAQEPVTFVFGEFGNPVQLDGAVVTDGISFRTIRQGCETLLAFEPGTTQPGPALATDWTVSEDGMTWTMNLIEGATFHDGTPFNAEAVVWNFNRWRLTSHPQHYAEQTFEYYSAQFGGFDDDSIITNVEATADNQVVFTLSQPMGAFLNNLAMIMFAISSPTAVETHGALYGTPEVGYVCTGPYQFVSWESDVEVVMERYPEYWGEVPGNVDRIVMQIIPDAGARLAALRDGTIDAFEGPNVEDIQGIEDAEESYIQFRPSFNTFYLAFSWRIQELQDVRVRQAISMAINRQEIVDAFYASAVAANTMNPPSIAVGYNPDVQQTFDPEGAMALLAEAGYPDGISEFNTLGAADGAVTDEVIETGPLKLFFMPVQRPYNPDGEGIGEAMVAYLQDVGINAELASVGDWAAYLDARANGELNGLYQLGWTGDNGDPDNFIGYFFADADEPLAREGFYENDEVSALLQEGRTLSDAATRDELYKQAEVVLNSDMARIFIAHGEVPMAFSSTVSGYITSPMGDESFKFVTVTE